VVVIETFEEARKNRRGIIGLVPTMGALHAGHMSLIERARRETETVIMSLFINPLQFTDPADLERYPRDFQQDVATAEAAGVDVVFAPDTKDMYLSGHRTRVTVVGASEHMEGAFRPGHFDGVATVVAKLLAGLQPDRTYFGRKDAQQLAVVTRLASDLSFPVEIVGCQLIREPDGLAISSRNVLINESERREALGLSRGLMAAADLVEQGVRSGGVIEGEVRRASPRITFDYVRLASQVDGEPVDDIDEPCFLAVAAKIGAVRLIDALHFDFSDDVLVVDRGRRLVH